MEFSSSSQGIIERRGERKSTESFEASHITFHIIKTQNTQTNAGCLP